MRNIGKIAIIAALLVERTFCADTYVNKEPNFIVWFKSAISKSDYNNSLPPIASDALADIYFDRILFNNRQTNNIYSIDCNNYDGTSCSIGVRHNIKCESLNSEVAYFQVIIVKETNLGKDEKEVLVTYNNRLIEFRLKYKDRDLVTGIMSILVSGKKIQFAKMDQNGLPIPCASE